MTVAIVGSRSCSLPAIATKVPDGTKIESRVRKLHRWLKNERIGAETYFLLYAAALLESLAASRTLLLAMVAAKWGEEMSEAARMSAARISRQLGYLG